MFEVKHLPATPAVARRLINFASMNNMVFDEKLAELALSGLLDRTLLSHLPYQTTPARLAALQHVEDWNGRAMVIVNSDQEGREIAMSSRALGPQGRTLILSDAKNNGAWVDTIRAIDPQAVISVFGNTRYKGASPLPQDLTFEEKPNLEADWLITNYGGLVWNDLVSKADLVATVVEELGQENAVHSRWNDNVMAMFHELPRPLFIQNLDDLPNTQRINNLTSLQTPGSRALTFINDTVRDYMWAGLRTFSSLLSRKQDANSLASSGYVDLNPMKILNIMGVSTHLLDQEAQKKPLVFYDNVAKRGTKTGDNLRRSQDAVAARSGKDISQLVQDALNDDTAARELLRGLQNNQWATFKSQQIHGVYESLANKTTKSLFFIEDRNLRRNVQLLLGTDCEDLGTAYDRNGSMRRWYSDANGGIIGFARYINSLIVGLDDLAQNPGLLDRANYLFLPQVSMNPRFHEAIMESCEIAGTRAVHMILRGTFEELCYQGLTKKP